MDYRLLGDPAELENGQYYVAVGTEKLKRYPYGEIPKHHTHRKGYAVDNIIIMLKIYNAFNNRCFT